MALDRGVAADDDQGDEDQAEGHPGRARLCQGAEQGARWTKVPSTPKAISTGRRPMRSDSAPTVGRQQQIDQRVPALIRVAVSLPSRRC